jgi:hypothetical protein
MRRCVALLVAVLVVGCGRHQRTYYVNPQASGAVTSASAPSTPPPVLSPPPAPPASGGGVSVGSATQPAPSAANLAALTAEAPRPGQRRVAADATEVTALALRVTSTSVGDVTLRGMRVRAEGLLDDSRGVRTALLAEDRDGDQRFDRAIDRALSSDGFTQDDGELNFVINETLAPNATLDLVVVLDFSGAARVNDTLRLKVEPGDLDATDAGGQAVALDLVASAGSTLRFGAWVEPHIGLATPGDGLWPRAVRDAQGRTHVVIYQNHNGNSDVWYSLFDGRSYSPVDDVSHAPVTSWNPDLAVEGGRPLLVWEAWDASVSDYAVRFSEFDPGNFSWTPTLDISGGPGGYPRIAVANGDVHVVWAERGAVTGIMHRVRTASGWSSVAEISSAAPGVQVETPHLVVDSAGGVFAAWAENGPGQSQVVGRSILPGGYAGREVVAAAPQRVERPFLLAEGPILHVAYEWGGEIYHSRRGAQSWLPGVNVSNSVPASSQAVLALHQGRVHALWIEDESGGGPTATQVAHAAAQGGGFGRVELLTRGPGARSMATAVSEGDRLKVLWQDWSLGRQRIFATWQEPSNLEAPRVVASPGAEPGRPAATRTRDGALAVAYALDAGGNGEVYVQVEDGPSHGFASAENVSRSATPSYKPSLATVSSRSLWLAWEEETASGFQIQVSERTPLGWSTPAAVSSDTAYAPSLSVGPGDVLVAGWSERQPSGRHGLVLRHLAGGQWTAPVVLAPGGRDVWSPHLAHSPSGDLLAVFELEGQSREVWIATRSGGVTSVAGVASSTRGQFAPRVAVSASGDVFVAWAEDGSVQVARRPVGAQRFDPVETLSSGGSWSVDLAASGDTLLVTWEQWQGSQVRPTHAIHSGGAWSAALPLDLALMNARRTVVLGGSGFELLWTTPTGLILRQRRED